MKDLDKKLYTVLFNPNMMNMMRYEKLRDLLREAYDMGVKDGVKTTDEVYQALFESDYYDDY